MNLTRIAAALRELANAIEDAPTTALQPTATTAPATNIDSLRAALGSAAKAGKTADCVRIMSGRKLGDLSPEELEDVSKQVAAL
jgi:hypothetical protein